MIQTESLQNALLILREITPLVVNITNSVVMNNTANALLAIGASPLMSEASEELPALIDMAQSLVINIGTLTNRTVATMDAAASYAHRMGRPWVLDPVGAGATRFRLDSCRRLLESRPTVVRGNSAEIQAIFADLEPRQESSNAARGVDSLIGTEAVTKFAMDYACQHRTIIAITGATDIITDGSRLLRIDNGHPMMARVTGTGCTATALIGAFLGAIDDPLTAAAAGLAALAIAGQLASQTARGPGSLQVNILDELYRLSPETIAAYLNMNNTPG